MCKFCEKARLQGKGDFGVFGFDHIGDAGTPSLPSTPSLSWEERLAAERCETLRKRRIPCALLTGFLGSGKTTLLNRILRQTKLRIAVIENEVGAISVDDKLIDTPGASLQRGSEAAEVVLLDNGCMCCRVRADLRDALERIIKAAPPEGLDAIILELSGLSEVGPVIQTFFKDPYVQATVGLDVVYCVVDASNLRSTLDSDSVLIREQLSLADVAILNKVDAVSGEHTKELVDLVSGLNGACTVRPVSLRDTSQALPEDLFGEQRFLKMNNFTVGVSSTQLFNSLASASPHKHDSLGYTSFSLEADYCLDRVKLIRLLEEIHEDQKAKSGDSPGEALTPLVRYKGIIFTGSSRIAMQGLYEHIEFHNLSSLPCSAPKRSQLVFIGRIDAELRSRLEAGVLNCREEPRSAPPPPPSRPLVADPGAAPVSGFASRMGSLKFGGREEF